MITFLGPGPNLNVWKIKLAINNDNMSTTAPILGSH